MKVLFVTGYYKPAYEFGGPVVDTAAICEHLVELGVDVTVFTTNAGGRTVLDVPVGQLVKVEGVDVWYFPLRFNGLGYFYANGLASQIRDQALNFNIIYTDALWGYASIPVYYASKLAVKPYVVKLHGQLEPWSLQQKSLKKKTYLNIWGKRLLNSANGLICSDYQELEELEDLNLKSPAFVIPNGVNIEEFRSLPTHELFRSQFNIPSDALVILFLGRLHPKKRPDLAIQVLSMMPESLKNCHLIIAGPDQEQMVTHLSIYAQELDCLERVHFTGMLDRKEVLAAFAASDLMIMPSEPLSENFGISALEALAAGVPILVSDGVPIGRWATWAEAGRMVSCNAQALSQAACELLADPSALKDMGERGKVLAQEKFDIRGITRQLKDQFQAIIETGKPLVQ